jgi:NhaP-type Na+/H+ or K+/H+ antiporter
MPFSVWFTVAGAVLIAMALGGTVLRRLPLSTGVVYLALGVALGPLGAGLLLLDPVREAALLERLAEVAVIVSLFAAGLKLRAPLAGGRWRPPLRLATVSMVATVALVALVATYAFGLPLGAAVLLGAVLAPTDPVLASDVRVAHTGDRDRLRFALTGEAGLNDGTAFPFVLLGLGLLGAHDLGAGLTRWLAVDVLWATAAGLAVGAACGWGVGRLVLYLRRTHREAVGTDDFLALGLIALAYGLALHAHAYGFLAVFAAGVALRRTAHAERTTGGGEDAGVAVIPLGDPEAGITEASTSPDKAPQFMVQAALGFTEQLERIGEVALVLVTGAVLLTQPVYPQVFWFIPLLLLVLRPLAVYAGLWGAPVTPRQKALAAWFGVRGVGSLYYLAYALVHGAPESLAPVLMSVTLWTVAVSITVHGVSVTPLMAWYARREGRRTGAEAGP